MSKTFSFRLVWSVAVALVAALALAGCGTGGGEGETLSLVGFAVPKAANNAIQAKWAQTPDGAGVRWQESYGASGDQSRAVASGLQADYVHLSYEGDLIRLVDAGLVAPDWNTGPTGGIVSDSVVVIAVREGNPKNIRGWDDLVRPGVGIVTPNPGSSGSARWNILAAYGQVIANGGSEQAARDYLTRFFENVIALPGSGRDATTAFSSGTGDAFITYENEAILARQNGAVFDYVIPDTTLLIENPGAVLKDSNAKAAKWLEFVLSEQGQVEFARKGFRPVIDGVIVEVDGANDPTNPFPQPATLMTVGKDFGGWPAALEKFFADETGLVPQVQRETGKS